MSSPHLPIQNPMLTIAVKAARQAGRVITQAADKLDTLTIEHKSLNDLVSEVDRSAEQVIISTLRGAYPEHSILAEESGASGQSEYQWIIDPLDGTTNYLHGFQQYSVSIGLAHRGILTHAVIYDPCRNDLFTASRGRGAYLNNRRLRVSRQERLIHCLVGTGFPFRMFDHLDAYMGMLRELMPKTAGIRRAGSAALDLANVAAGRLDGFWEIGLAPWDMAAGALLILEAGGLVGDLQGNDGYLHNGCLVAGNPRIFVQLLQTLSPHVSPALRTLCTAPA